MSPYRNESARGTDETPSFNHYAGEDQRRRRRAKRFLFLFAALAVACAAVAISSAGLRASFEYVWPRATAYGSGLAFMIALKRLFDWREARRPDYFTKKLARETAEFLAPEMMLSPPRPTATPASQATGVAADVPSPIPASEATRVADDIPTRVALDIPTRVALDIPTRVALDIPTRVAADAELGVADAELGVADADPPSSGQDLLTAR